MAIIYTYPTKATPVDNDLILISDSADSNKTKQVTVASIKGLTSGVTSVAATLPLVASAATGDTTLSLSGLSALGTAGQVIKVNSGATGLEWGTAGGGTPDTPVNSVQFNEAGAFGGSGDFKYDDSTKVLTIGDQDVNRGIISIAGGSSGAGELRLGDPGTSGGTVTLKGGNDHSISYTIKLPDDSPTANNKILESDASGNLTWIDTPTGGGVSFSGSTANGIATYSNSTTAAVSSVFTVSGDKLSAPSGTLADPSIEVGAVGGLYAASGGILLAHNGVNAIGVSSASIINYKLTQFDAGLKFGATGETLNSYEEGTWTPAPWVYSGTAPTVVSANGTYTIIGDICHITFQIVVTGSSSSNAAMILDGLPAVAQGDATNGEQSAGQLFVNTDSNTYDAIPSMFYVSGDKLTMVVQGGSKNSFTSPYGLKAQDVIANWNRPTAGSGITLKGSATYKLL